MAPRRSRACKRRAGVEKFLRQRLAAAVGRGEQRRITLQRVRVGRDDLIVALDLAAVFVGAGLHDLGMAARSGGQHEQTSADDAETVHCCCGALPIAALTSFTPSALAHSAGPAMVPSSQPEGATRSVVGMPNALPASLRS